MAEVEILSNGDDTPGDDDVLELGEAPETVVAAEGDDAIEPLDAEDFPDTFDEVAGEETPLVKLLREKAKSDAREKREMAAQLAQLQSGTRPTRTKEPDLWDDCDGDTDKFKAEFIKWQKNEAAVDEAERAPQLRANQQVQEFEQTRLTYKANAEKMGKADFADAESNVVATMDDAQQSTILLAAKDPAKFIYALGRSPNRLAQLSLITNPIKLAAEVARIEGVRSMPRKEPPTIDTPVRGSARLSTSSGDAQRDKLIEKAQKTGDSTELLNYDRAQKAKQAA